MKKLLFTSAILLGVVSFAAAQDAKSQSKAKAVAPNKTEQPAPVQKAAPRSSSVKTSKANAGISKAGSAKAVPASATSLFDANAQKNKN